MAIDYVYTKKNLLDEPEKYEMTPYMGYDFLISFLKSRENFLQSNFIDVKNFQLATFLSTKSVKLDPIEDNFLTFDLFSEILKKLINKNLESKFISLIDIFLKKFEIRKKIFISYDTLFQETSPNYDDLKNYVILSIICQILFERNSRLKYLNVSLKLNDVICSQKKIPQNEKPLISFLIKNEIKHLKKMSKKIGVAFP